jgi:hypothetical protein
LNIANGFCCFKAKKKRLDRCIVARTEKKQQLLNSLSLDSLKASSARHDNFHYVVNYRRRLGVLAF